MLELVGTFLQGRVFLLLGLFGGVEGKAFALEAAVSKEEGAGWESKRLRTGVQMR